MCLWTWSNKKYTAAPGTATTPTPVNYSDKKILI
jgi:hypothetical protein